MASSATMRAGRLLSSATARGMLFGSPPPSASRRRAPFAACSGSMAGSFIDGVGIELLLNPLGQAHLPHALDVAWPRAVREAVQSMQNRFVRAQFGNRQAFQRRIRFLLLFFGGWKRGGTSRQINSPWHTREGEDEGKQ